MEKRSEKKGEVKGMTPRMAFGAVAVLVFLLFAVGSAVAELFRGPVESPFLEDGLTLRDEGSLVDNGTLDLKLSLEKLLGLPLPMEVRDSLIADVDSLYVKYVQLIEPTLEADKK